MRVYCINLDKRPERWAHAQQECEKVGWEPERFSAIEATPGWKGCRDSHLKLLEEKKDEGTFCVIEDDVLFYPTLNLVLEDAMGELPHNWDMLYLGCSPKKPQQRYSSSLFQLDEAHVTHAIIWQYREGGAIDYILKHKKEIEKIDDFFAMEVQPRFNCFVTSPMCATQSDAFDSDIAKRSDVSTIMTNFKKYCR